MFRVIVTSFVLLAALVPAVSSQEDLVHFGFEDGDVQGWQVVAGEFPQPVCQYAARAGGNLPKSLGAKQAKVDPYATDQAYWRSFWWKPEFQEKTQND